jgi:hypothetical protein
MEADWLNINANAANKVRNAPDPKNARCEQYCSLFTSLSVVASAVGCIEGLFCQDMVHVLASMSRPAGGQAGDDSISIGAFFYGLVRHFLR